MVRRGHVQRSRRFMAGVAFLIATLVVPSTAIQPVRAADAGPGEFTLSVSLAGSSTAGTVTSAPTGIDCGIVCSHPYPGGAVVTLTQLLRGPDADGSTFVGWSGDGDCADGTVTMTDDLSCTATFDLIRRSADSTTGAGPVIFATNAGSLASLTAIAEDTLPTADKPSGLSFDFGFFSWTVDGLDPGETVTMTMTYPSAVQPGAAFWKVIGADWIDASSLLGSNDGDDVLTLTITDGGIGDADGIANGSISDPGAVGVTPIRRRTLGITKSGNGSGTVTSAPPGINCGLDCVEGYAQGTVVVLTGTPDPGSSFVGFSGALDCTDGSLTMTFPRTCVATFVSRILTVNKLGNGTGTVTSAPPGINCGLDCSEGFATGTVVTLTATPDPGSSFVGFTGNPDCYDGTVKMTFSFHCVASFVSRLLTVARMGNGSGIVTSAPAGINCGVDCSEGYPHGTVVVLSAFPTLGSSFAGFSGNPDCSDGTVTMIAPRHCVATFVSRLLTIEIAGNGFGTVTSLPAGIECGEDCREGYGDGTEVVLSATAAPGSTFTGFGGNADCADGVVEMTSQRTCVATFVSRVLTVRLEGTGSGIVTSAPAGIACGLDCSEGFEDGTLVVLSATSSPSSTFAGFGGNSDCIDGILTMTAARTCIATFKAVGS